MRQRAGAILLLTATLHCRRSRDGAGAGEAAVRPLVLTVLEVRNAPVAAPGRIAVDTEALKSLIGRRMEASGLVVTATPPVAVSPAAAQLRIAAQVSVEIVEVADKGRVDSAVAIRLDTRPSDAAGAMNEELSATGEGVFAITGEPPGNRRAELAQRTTERTVGDLLDGFLARMRLRIATPEALHGLIRQDGPLREDAVRQVGARQMKDEAPYLLTLLHHDTESVRDAALGALLALHEVRAVHELTTSRSMKDRREMRKILDAIAALGGDEAMDYLAFVAEGHTDDEIRKMAAEARDRLQRKPDAAAGK